jgi:pimeloyl-ACP methyl ester carboxylesterase
VFFAGLSPRRRALLTAIVALAVIGALLAGIRVLRGPGAVPAQDRPGSVVLVPGFGGSLGAMDVLAARIRATGRDVRVVALPDDGVGDLNGQAAALDEYVTQALRDGAPSVDVIGYSAGGVVARLWVQSHDGAHKARRVITLGSPHHGASIAAAGASGVPGACTTACQQLAPGSRLLAGLSVPVPVPPAWLSIWTVDDQTVTPPDSARLEGAINLAVQSLCPRLRVSHSELPTDGLVTSLVLDSIGAAPLSEPPAVACVSS